MYQQSEIKDFDISTAEQCVWPSEGESSININKGKLKDLLVEVDDILDNETTDDVNPDEKKLADEDFEKFQNEMYASYFAKKYANLF